LGDGKRFSKRYSILQPHLQKERPVSLLPELPLNTRLPSKRETVDAIKTMKNGKAVGPNNIPDKVPKADPYAVADILLPLLQDMWQKEKFPKEWKQGIITRKEISVNAETGVVLLYWWLSVKFSI
jgi:hypothetical protein